MAEIKNGLLINGQVTQKIISNIERPGLDFKKINSLSFIKPTRQMLRERCLGGRNHLTERIL